MSLQDAKADPLAKAWFASCKFKHFAHSSHNQPQGNVSFYADIRPPIILRQSEGAKRVQAELHYQRFRETNIIKKLSLLCYITSTLLFYVSIFRNQNYVYSIPATPGVTTKRRHFPRREQQLCWWLAVVLVRSWLCDILFDILYIFSPWASYATRAIPVD